MVPVQRCAALLVAGTLSVAALAGCGEATEETPSAITQRTVQSPPMGDPYAPTEIADTYAREVGGKQGRCLEGDPGAEAASHPGCIYAAAFTGCVDGVDEERERDSAIEDEFPEPELVAVYERAYSDCAEKRP